MPSRRGRPSRRSPWILLLLLQCILTETLGRRRPQAMSKLQRLSCNRVLKELEDALASGLALPSWQQQQQRVLSKTNNSTTTTATPNMADVEHLRLGPCRGNLYEWHFSFAGPPDTVFEGGVYHGRVLLPADYPASAPHVQMLTPNGRFEVRTDICLSASAFHQETWQPAWTVRTLVSALRAHMATRACEIGGIELPTSRRLRYAERSRTWRCPSCDCDHSDFPGQVFKSMPAVDYRKWAVDSPRGGVMAAGGGGNSDSSIIKKQRKDERRRGEGRSGAEGALGRRKGRRREGGFVAVVSGLVLSPPFLALGFIIFFLFLNLAS